MPIRITKEEVAAIHAAMEKHSGNVRLAAQDVNLAVQTLYNKINSVEDLRLKWGKTKDWIEHAPAPTKLEVAVHRSKIPIDPDQAAIARAMEKEDMALQKGFRKMGIREDSMAKILGMMRFHGQHYTRSLEIMGGGMTKLFVDLMEEREKLTAELEAGGKHTTAADGSIQFMPLTPAREMLLRQDRQAVTKAMQDAFSLGSKAAMTQAVIKHKLSKRGQSNKPRGFLKIEAAAGSTTNVALMPEANHADVEMAEGE